MIDWFSKLPVQVQAAVVGVLAATAVGGLRDLVWKWWLDRKAAKKSAENVYRRYAEPLASAATSLFWRLKEVFGPEGRASYLAAKEPRTIFENYKLRSTYYRLAALLGWIRALRRELSFFRLEGEDRLNTVEDAIANFEASLADGHHVELQRLDGLLQIWGLPKVSDSQLRLRVSVEVENCGKRYLQRVPVPSATDLTTVQQIELCRDIAQLVCERANFARVTIEVLTETRSRAIRQIAIREAWLYRDWQTAIGDLMIREATTGIRRFEVLGFGEFESMLLGPTADQFRSLDRIAMLFDEIDLALNNPFDARPAALGKLYRATAEMVRLISKAPSSASLIDSKTAGEAGLALQAPVSHGHS